MYTKARPVEVEKAEKAVLKRLSHPGQMTINFAATLVDFSLGTFLVHNLQHC